MMIVPENQSLTYPDEISRSLKQLKLDFKPIKSNMPTIKTIKASHFNSPQSIEDNLSFLYPFLTRDEIRAILRENNHNADEAKASILRNLDEERQNCSDKRREEPLLSKKRLLTEMSRSSNYITNDQSLDQLRPTLLSLSDKVKVAAIKIVEMNPQLPNSAIDKKLKQILAPLLSGK